MKWLAAFVCGVPLFYIYRFFPFSVATAAAAVAVFLIYKKTFSSGCADSASNPIGAVFLVMFTAALGFCYAKISYVQPASLSDLAGVTVAVEGTAASEAVRTGDEEDIFSQVVEIKSAKDGNNNPLVMREMRIAGGFILQPGRLYALKAKIPNDAYFLNPGSRKNIISAYLLEAKEIGPFSGKNFIKKYFSDLRHRLNIGLKNTFSAESAPFLMSITTGERGLMPEEMKNAFNAAGLAHILSISGAHFGLLFAVIFAAFRLIVKMLPYRLLVRLTIHFTPSQLAAMLAVPVISGYLGISGMSFPAVRSFIMIFCFLFGLLIHRKGFWLNTLLFAAAVILIIEPASILSLSFQLSFIAVLCIGIVAEREKNRTEGRKLTGYLRASVLISLAAAAGTAPLVAYNFHYFPILSPVTNIFITPLIGFIILPASIISSFVYLFSGSFPFSGALEPAVQFVLSMIMHVSKWEFAEVKIPAFPLIIPVAFYAGIFAALFFYMRRRAVAFVFSAVLCIVPIAFFSGAKLIENKGLSITYLDAGQGDAAVVELPDKRTIVVDTGRNGFAAGEFLRYRGIKNVEAVVLSHAQADHAGGIRYLLKHFGVSEIWDNNRLVYAPDLLNGVVRRGLGRGDVLQGNGYKIEFFHPYVGYRAAGAKDAENNESLVFRVQGGKNGFLFTGDMEKEGSWDVSFIGNRLKSAVLKVPHHGSRSALSEEFLKAVSPEVAVISAGRNNIYGHPHPETLAMFKGARIFMTGRDGALCVSELAGGKLHVKTWKEFVFLEASSVEEELMNIKRLFLTW